MYKNITDRESKPSDIIYGILSVLFGIVMIKTSLFPFSLFFFLGVFFLIGGAYAIKTGYKAMRRKAGKPVDEDEEEIEEICQDNEELRCPNCEALLQKGDLECPYCGAKL